MNKMKKVMIYLPIVVLTVLAFGAFFAPNDPNQVDLSMKLVEPSLSFPLGTDAMGRCVLSRLLYGGRTTIGVVFVGSVMVLFVGLTVGMSIGYFGKGQNVVIESFLNALTAIPPMALLIVFVGAWGNGVVTMLVALTISLLMRVIKLVKTETELALKKAYVSCAVACGVSRGHLLVVQVLPNIIGNTIRFLTLSCGDMIMCIVSFSFIGIGFDDNVIDWGMMVSEARRVIFLKPILIIYPILAIFLSILSFNTLSFGIGRGGHDVQG